jgi:hypothetical protein
MRRFLTSLALSAAVALGSIGGAAASDPVVVGFVSCVFVNGGEATVPSFAPVVVTFGWAADTKAQVSSFLKAATVYAFVDGVRVPNGESYFSAPAPVVTGGWATYWSLPTGRSLSSGESVTLAFNVYLSRKVATGRDPDSGRLLRVGPGFILPTDTTCTVTGE